jgi:hypothetical protein
MAEDSAQEREEATEDPAGRFTEAISELKDIAHGQTPEDAAGAFDQPTLEVFWREWPDISEWAGTLWRRLNADLADAAKPVKDPLLDETGGGD